MFFSSDPYRHREVPSEPHRWVKPRGRLSKEKTAPSKDTLYQPAAPGTRSHLSEKPLSWHEHTRGDRCVDQPHRSKSTGTCPCQTKPLDTALWGSKTIVDVIIKTFVRWHTDWQRQEITLSEEKVI